MAVNLKPYKVLLNRLKDEIFALGRARTRMAEKYEHEEGYIKLLYSLEQESRAMEYQWKEMNSYFKGIGLLLSRLKRAVVPIVGKPLFSTVSEGDVKIIWRKLSDVERNQKTMAQVAQESL